MPVQVEDSMLWAEMDLSDDEAPLNNNNDVQEQIKIACMAPYQRKEYEDSRGSSASPKGSPKGGLTPAGVSCDIRRWGCARGSTSKEGKADGGSRGKRNISEKVSSPKDRQQQDLAIWAGALGRAKQTSKSLPVVEKHKPSGRSFAAALAAVAPAKKEKRKIHVSMEGLLAWSRPETADGDEDSGLPAGPSEVAADDLGKAGNCEQKKNLEGLMSSGDGAAREREERKSPDCGDDDLEAFREESASPSEEARGAPTSGSSDDVDSTSASSHLDTRSSFDSAESIAVAQAAPVTEAPASLQTDLGCSDAVAVSGDKLDALDAADEKSDLETINENLDTEALRRSAPQGFEKPSWSRITVTEMENPNWVPGSTDQPKHLADYKFWDEWDMWFTYPKGMGPNSRKLNAGKAMCEKDFDNILFKMGELDSVAAFIQAVERLKTEAWTAGAVVSVCRKGITPKWEDPANTNGGRFMFKGFRKDSADQIFERLAIGLMSGQFHDWENYNIISLHLRENRRGHDIQLWRRVVSSNLGIGKVRDDVIALVSEDAYSSATLTFVPNRESVIRNDGKLTGSRGGPAGRRTGGTRYMASGFSSASDVEAVFGGVGNMRHGGGFKMSEADKEAMIGDMVAAAERVVAANRLKCLVPSGSSSIGVSGSSSIGGSRVHSNRGSARSSVSAASSKPGDSLSPAGPSSPELTAYYPSPHDNPVRLSRSTGVEGGEAEAAGASEFDSRAREDLHFANWRQWHSQQMQHVAMMRAMGMPVNCRVNVFQARQWLPERRCFESCVMRTPLGDPIVYGYPVEEPAAAHESGSLLTGCHSWAGSVPAEGCYWSSSDSAPPSRVIVMPTHGGPNYQSSPWAEQHVEGGGDSTAVSGLHWQQDPALPR